MNERALAGRRALLLLASLVLMVVGTKDIRALRAYRETVVVSDAFTRQVPLSTYFDGIRGTLMDVPVFLFDSGRPGGSVLILAGAHPYEPASPMTAYVMMENLAVAEGGCNRAGQFMHLMPAFGTLLSMLFLGEQPALYHLAGIALILAGIFLTTRVRA